MTFPLLYHKTKTGAIQTYQVSCSEDTITVTQGQLEGKKQSYPTKCTPKNTGRANATTGPQQAILEAKAKHTNKINDGYTLDPSGESEKQLPMKVKTYQDQLNNIEFPCRVMTKYNGINAIFRPSGITSRGGNPYPAIPHLHRDLAEISSALETTTLGGELYIHNHHLQDITSAVKKPKELSKKLVLMVFSLPDSTKTFEEVCQILNKCPSTEYVKPCHSVIANSHSELDALHNDAVANGFEGIVIYNQSGVYQYNTRSSNAFKYKLPKEAEYRILSYETDKNGHPVFTCEYIDINGNTDTFKVKPKGTDTERKTIITSFNSGYKNSWYTVEFETLSKIGKPLKPCGVCLRDCNSEGSPLV